MRRSLRRLIRGIVDILTREETMEYAFAPNLYGVFPLKVKGNFTGFFGNDGFEII